AVFIPDGKMKPISEFADVVIHSGEAEIDREDLQGIGVVTARLDNRDLGSTMNEIKAAVATKMSLANGYTISYGGAYAEQQQSFKELFMILVISSLLVFSVILFLFRDIWVALIILTV